MVTIDFHSVEQYMARVNDYVEKKDFFMAAVKLDDLVDFVM